jgi:hypothetical protein
VEDQAEANRAPNVAKKTLQGSKMGLPRIMHMEADLLDSVGEVRPGESEVP